MIVGGPGSGKTWLADVLGKRLGLPGYSVDDAIWDRYGHLRPAPEIDDIVCALPMQDSWIIEGGNTRTYAERARAPISLFGSCRLSGFAFIAYMQRGAKTRAFAMSSSVRCHIRRQGSGTKRYCR